MIIQTIRSLSDWLNGCIVELIHDSLTETVNDSTNDSINDLINDLMIECAI